MSEEENLLSDLLVGSSIIFIGNVIGMGAGFLTRVVAGRYLGPEHYGIIVTALSFVNIISIVLLLGLPQGLARQIPRSDSSLSLVKGSLIFVSAAAFLICVLATIFYESILNLLFQKPTPLFLPFIWGIPAYIIVRILVGVFRGTEKPEHRVIMQDFIYQGGIAIFVLLFTFLGAKYTTIAIGWNIIFYIAALFGLVIFAKYYSLKEIASTPVNFGQLKNLMGFSLPLMLSSTIWVLLNNVDNLLISIYKQSGEIGIYDSAFTLARLLMMVPSAAGFIILPLISRLESEGRIQEVHKIYNLSTKWMGFAASPLIMILVVFPEKSLSVIYGSQYSLGAPVLTIVAIGFFTHTILGLNSNGLTAFGFTRPVLIGHTFALLANIGLNIFLIPIYGIRGAAAASAFSYIIMNIYLAYTLYLKTGIQPLSKKYILPLLLSFCSVFLLRLFFKNNPSTYVNIVISSLLFLLVHTTGIFALGGFNDGEWKMLKNKFD